MRSARWTTMQGKDAGGILRNVKDSLRLIRPQRRILVVDDDVNTTRAIKYLAEMYSPGCVVHVVNDPYEGLLALADFEFDLVLVDQKIPGMKGSDLLSQIDVFVDEDPTILDSGRYVQKVPVVLMSGSADLSSIADHYNNFVIQEKLKKRDLGSFLSRTFAV